MKEAYADSVNTGIGSGIGTQQLARTPRHMKDEDGRSRVAKRYLLQRATANNDLVDVR